MEEEEAKEIQKKKIAVLDSNQAQQNPESKGKTKVFDRDAEHYPKKRKGKYDLVLIRVCLLCDFFFFSLF